MTKLQLDAIRERRAWFDTDGGLADARGAVRTLVADIAALLDHCDRYAALTPEVIETAIRNIESLCEEFGWDEESYRARAALESLK